MPLIGTIPQTTSGTAAPNPANGMDGDIYFLVDANGVVLIVYQKIVGTWTSVGDINPAWINYTPTITAGSGTITSFVSVASKYRLIGKVCFLYVSVWINAPGTGAGALKVSLPVDPIALGACASAFSTIAGGVAATGFVTPVGVLPYPNLTLLKYDGTTVIGASIQTIASVTYETL